MGIKEEPCHDDHGVMNGSVELLYGTPETNRIHVN